MTIQLNGSKDVTIHETHKNKLNSLLTDELAMYSEHITRLEVHLTDENGSRQGINDKRCLLEARLEGRQPIAVTGFANTYELAVNSAIDKLKTSLNTIIGRMRNH